MTLSLLGVVSAINLHFVNTPFPVLVIVGLTVAAVGWTFVTRRNRYVSHLLLEGWLPLFAAMAISCGTGIVLDLFVSRYEGFALLATVISGTLQATSQKISTHFVATGLPGNVGSILVSRLSTALHADEYSSTALPGASTDSFVKPSSIHPPSPRLVMVTLLCVTVPVELVFLGVLRALGWLRMPILFIIFSLIFFCFAVSPVHTLHRSLFMSPDLRFRL